MADTTTHERLEETSDKANEDEKSLPFMDKLQLLDQEIRLLQECCQKLGLNSKEIECCAEPLLKEQRTENRKKWWTRVFCVSLLVAFIAFILWYEPTYRYICIFGKLSSMKVNLSRIQSFRIQQTQIDYFIITSVTLATDSDSS